MKRIAERMTSITMIRKECIGNKDMKQDNDNNREKKTKRNKNKKKNQNEN